MTDQDAAQAATLSTAVSLTVTGCFTISALRHLAGVRLLMALWVGAAALGRIEGPPPQRGFLTC
jgi:hypothetical protein